MLTLNLIELKQLKQFFEELPTDDQFVLLRTYNSNLKITDDLPKNFVALVLRPTIQNELIEKVRDKYYRGPGAKKRRAHI